MSTSIAVMGVNEVFDTFSFFMSTSIAIKQCVEQLYINFVLCQFPLQFFGCDGKILISFVMIFISTCFMSTSIAHFTHITSIHIHVVLCQLPLQLSDALMKFILNLFYVSFHCNYKVH